MSKVKYQCKFCSKDVTPKSGLKCQGTCNRWAHYKCLQYSPKKIDDIRAGYLQIHCPCASCENNHVDEVKEPKETHVMESNFNSKTDGCVVNQEFDKNRLANDHKRQTKHDGDTTTDSPKKVDRSINTKAKYKYLARQLNEKNPSCAKHSPCRKHMDKKVPDQHYYASVPQPENQYTKPKVKHYPDCSQNMIAPIESDSYHEDDHIEHNQASSSASSLSGGGNNEESDSVFESTLDGLCTTMGMFQQQFEELTGRMKDALNHI